MAWTALLDRNSIVISNNNASRSTVLRISGCYSDRLDRCKKVWADLEKYLNKNIPLPDTYLMELRAGDPVIVCPHDVVIFHDSWHSSKELSRLEHNKIITSIFSNLDTIETE